MGVDWPTSLELIRRSLDAAEGTPGALIASGAGTDQLEPSPSVTIDDVIAAYEEQCGAIENLGGNIVLMASRALAKAARAPDDYQKVYGRILDQVKEPVIIHWLGEMFDPALEGYWGYRDHYKAMPSVEITRCASSNSAGFDRCVMSPVWIANEGCAGSDLTLAMAS